MESVPNGFCQCGCGERTSIAKVTRKRWGQVKGEPIRFLRGHNGRKSVARYLVHETTGCWIWQGSTDANPHGDGYGRVGRSGKSAHRVYYEERHGPIPSGYHVHHTCNRTLCVNPDHLEALPARVHVRLRRDAKLTAGDVNEIKRRFAEDRLTRQELADIYSVCHSHIASILRGRHWPDS